MRGNGKRVRRRGRAAASIVMACDDAASALHAMDDFQRLSHDMAIEPDVVAAVVKRRDGRWRTISNRCTVGSQIAWWAFVGLVVGLPYYAPVPGMLAGAAFGLLVGEIAQAIMDRRFQDRARDVLERGNDAIVMLARNMPEEAAVEAVSRNGGAIRRVSHGPRAESRLLEGLPTEPGPTPAVTH